MIYVKHNKFTYHKTFIILLLLSLFFKIKIGKRVNTLTISRNQSLERYPTPILRSFRRGTNTSAVYKIDSGTIPETSSYSASGAQNVAEKEPSPSINTSIVQDDTITPDVTIDVNAKEIEEHAPHTIPLKINNHNEDSSRFSIYEEDDNIIIEDEVNGNVYVINNPPSATTQGTDTNSQRSYFNLFPLFNKSSQEQNDR
jgi:hypothetical protein